MSYRTHVKCLLAATLVLLTGCVYEAPLTDKPTAKIDDRLLGDWVESDNKDHHMYVAKLSDSEYVVAYSETIFRVCHSDFAGLHIVSAQNIGPLDAGKGKYSLESWELQDDGKKLVLRTINNKVVAETLKTTADIQKAITDNLKNPDLFNPEAGTFLRVEK